MIAPLVLPRIEWGAEPPVRIRPLAKFSSVEFHHSASPGFSVWERLGSEAVMQAIQENHFRNGWNDIFYHRFVMPDGTVYVGRESDGPVMRVCFLGNFEEHEPTEAQKDVLLYYIDTYGGDYTWHQKRAAGTRYASLCPGANLIRILQDPTLLETPMSDTVDPTSFVTRLYEGILGRDPDEAGFNYWVGLLESGEAASVQVLVEFLAVRQAADDAVAAATARALDMRSDLGLSIGEVRDISREVFSMELSAWADAVRGEEE